jgi:hypothetical protein
MVLKIKKITTTKKWEVKTIKYPYSNTDSVINIRSEKCCVFCDKPYLKCNFFGIVMTDKGSNICCDECCENIDENRISN